MTVRPLLPKEARHKVGWSVREAAARLAFPTAWVRDIESGEAMGWVLL